MTDAVLRPLETQYRGYRFRSRLEARWAVLLNTIKVRWQYEPEGFDLDGVWYLPDFWIRLADRYQCSYPQGSPPECGFWLEIKPTTPDAATLQKCAALSRLTRHCVYLAAGSIGPGEFSGWKWHPSRSEPQPLMWRNYDSMDYCELSNSLIFYLLFEACPSENHPFSAERAYRAARAARFEHGECA